VQDFRKLKVWEKAHAVTLAVYRVRARFPADERFGLTIQLRRTATLVPMNIAEGCGRATDPEFLRCLSGAMGAANQLEYQLLLAHDLEFLPAKEHERLTTDAIEVKRMIAGLMNTLSG
jgi:four helix bundle protein